MSTILDLYKYAALATASYVRMGGTPLTGEDLAREANAQQGGRIPQVLGTALFIPADASAPRWTILRYYGGDIPANQDPVAAEDRSGFGATLFERNGEKVLALRGTEPFEDGSLDLGGAGIGQIGILGLALTQVVSMVNLIQRMRFDPGIPVVQLRLNASVFPPAGPHLTVAGAPPLYLSFSSYVGSGVGGIVPGEKITVTGHSLGGHLAFMAARLFPDVVNSQVPVFNAAGYDPSTANFVGLSGPSGVVAIMAARAYLVAEFGLAAAGVIPVANQLTEPALSQIVTALRGTGTQQGAPVVINLRTEDIVPGDDTSVVASRVTGADRYPVPIDLPSEANSHLIEPFMDALALQTLLFQMGGNTFALEDATFLLEVSSDQLVRSEEQLTEALFQLFLRGQKFIDSQPEPQQSLDALPTSDATGGHISKGTLAARAAFHDAVLRIGDAIKNKGYLLERLLDVLPADLVKLAQRSEGLAYRYALRELNPFAIVGDDALYALHNPRSTPEKQDGPLDLYDPTTGVGLTPEYLADRTEMLGWKNQDYSADGQRVLRSNQIETYQFTDKTLKNDFGNDLTFTIRGRRLGSVSNPAKITFGGDAPESLAGSDLAVGDHLYGDGGDDLLDGQGGSDCLEGGANNDTLLGGEGNDVLLAGAGDDTLVGGAGQDVLDGGPGFDTYRFFAGDGLDRIADADGLGQIFYDGVLLAGGAKLGPDLWESDDGRFQFALTAMGDGAQTLSVSGSGTLLVKDFAPGKLGISLEETTPQAPTVLAGGFEIRGDQAYKIFVITDPAVRNNPPDAYRYVALNPQSQYPNMYYLVSEKLSAAGEGYILRDPMRPWTAGPQVLIGTVDADNVVGSDEGNTIVGNGGDDHLVGGVAVDGIGGGEGNDFIEGGAFFNAPLADWLSASTTYPGGEFIEGAVDDNLAGGPGNDVLFGGMASDWDALLDPQTPAAGHKGDWLGGNGGEDDLYGSTGDDVLQGGGGKDLLVGGPGADVLSGDDDFGFGHFEYPSAGLWSVERGSSPIDVQFFPVSVFPWFTWPDYYKLAGDDDTLFGGTGGDILLGQLGDDMLFGEVGDDVLAGWEGDDTLIGGEGEDIIAGDFGRHEQPDERLVGFTYQVPAGFLDFTTGSSGPVEQTGRDYLDGGAGNDILLGEGGDDVALGGEGHDELWGDAAYLPEELHGNDYLVGGAGEDTLNGGAGDDILIGGPGDDAFDGGEGSDVYEFARGDGADLIADSGMVGADVLTFDEYAQSEVAIHRLADGSLVIIGAYGDAVTIQEFAGNEASGIERIQFADGTTLDQEAISSLPVAASSIGGDGWTQASDTDDVIATFELLSGAAGGFVMVDAGSGNDTVYGGFDAVVYGNQGNDELLGGNTLIGGDGDDRLSDAVTLIGGTGSDELLNGSVLDGGPGDDVLNGGYGASRYLITPDDAGIDTISDNGESQDSYLESYYSSLGIVDWRERRFVTQPKYVVIEYGSFATLEDASAVLAEFFHVTWDEALDRGLASVLEPLPPAPQISANDYAALAPLYAAGVIEIDAVEFRQDLTAGELSLSWGEVASLSPVSGALEAYTTLDVGWGPGSVARVVIPHTEDPLGTGLEEFRFADGSVLSMQEMVAAAPSAPSFDPQFESNVLTGSARGEVILGKAGNDTLEGLAGEDFLYGGAGSDILMGGDGADELSDEQGNNLLDGGMGEDAIHADGLPNYADGGSNFVIGGAGNDWIYSLAANNVIAFNAGDGQDAIYTLNALTLSLGGGVESSALALSRDEGDLVLAIGASDSIRLTRQYEPDPQAWPQITLQMFGSVHLYDFNAVIVDFHAALAADQSLAGFSLDGVLKAHETSVSETGAIGGALAHQYGTVGNLDALSAAAILQVLDDASFGTAPQNIAVPGGSQAPVIGVSIPDQSTPEDAAFNSTMPPDSFVDVDAGDSLTLSAAMTDGLALPVWLTFDPVSGTFSGTPGNGDVGSLNLRVTATDMAGAVVSDEFTLEVVNVNDAPGMIALLADQFGNQNAAFNFQVPNATFTDPDAGDTLTLSAAPTEGGALPAWLSFDSATGIFSGTPSEFDVGAMNIRVTATDTAGATAADTFTLSVSDTSTVSETHVGTEQRDAIATGSANDWIDAGRGDDLVHAGAGRDMVFGGKGHDWIAGQAGNDELQGEEGHDHLFGGLGDDLYRYEHRGGHDVIEEMGGHDTLLLGEGISAERVQLFRRHDDLLVDLKGRDGSVTVRGWFASDLNKVETIRFANGTVWGVEDIHGRLKSTPRSSGRLHDSDRNDDRHDDRGDQHGKSDGRKHDGGDSDRTDRKGDSMTDCLAAYLGRKPRYAFEALALELESSDWSGEIPNGQEIARRWQVVGRYASALAIEHDEDARGGAQYRFSEHGLFDGRAFGGGFGYTGSTGKARSGATLRGLQGLEEGLQRLHA